MKKRSVWFFILATLSLGTTVILRKCCRKDKNQDMESDNVMEAHKEPQGTQPAVEEQPLASEQPEARRVELSKEAKKRLKRSDAFDEFHKKAKEIFEPFKENGEREEYFEALYNLAVCPGSRMGGRESRIVEFFWGNRIFDKTEGLSADLRRKVKFDSEAGASMFFFKNDDGYVSIQLYPAHTDNRRPIEDFIFWRMRVNPSCLLKNRFQKCCWRAFMAYMEVTSLDGCPSLFQRIHVWYLRHFKHVIIEKKETPIKIVVALQSFFKWVSTVTFSGLAIFLLQLWLIPSPSEHQNIKDIRESAMKMENEFEDIKEEIKDIRENQDSLNVILKESMMRYQETKTEGKQKSVISK